MVSTIVITPSPKAAPLINVKNNGFAKAACVNFGGVNLFTLTFALWFFEDYLSL